MSTNAAAKDILDRYIAGATFAYILLVGIATDWITEATKRAMNFAEDLAADEMAGYVRPTLAGLATSEDDANNRAELTAGQATINNLAAATFAGCSMTAASAVLTSSGAPFAAGDVGKIVRVPGAGAAGADLYSRIASYQANNQVTLSDAAGTTVADVAVAIAVAGVAVIRQVTDDTDSPILEVFDIRPAAGQESTASFPSGANFQVSAGADGILHVSTV